MGRRVTTQDSPASPSPRIGIDALTLGPPMSGVGQVIHNLLKSLPQAAPEFDYLVYRSRTRPHGPGADLSPLPVKRTWLPTRFRPVRILWQQAALPVQARMHKVDLIHAPAYTAPIATSKPVVLTIYDTIALTFPELSKRLNVLHYRMFMSASAKRAARIIVPSEATRKDVIAVLGVPSDKIRVVPLAVAEAFRPVEDVRELGRVRKELGLPERYILFTGNIEPKKNLPALLRAYAEARRSGRVTHRLVVAGRKAWRYSQVFKTLRELRIQETVHFIGHVPQEMLPALYSGASVFVFPSLCEGFGLPPLEAMACGTPVVTTTAGALPEVVGNAALTVKPDDVRELRVAMEKVLANQFLARRLREYGIKRAAEFSWHKTARATADVYAEVLSSAVGG